MPEPVRTCSPENCFLYQVPSAGHVEISYRKTDISSSGYETRPLLVHTVTDGVLCWTCFQNVAIHPIPELIRCADCGSSPLQESSDKAASLSALQGEAAVTFCSNIFIHWRDIPCYSLDFHLSQLSLEFNPGSLAVKFVVEWMALDLIFLGAFSVFSG